MKRIGRVIEIKKAKGITLVALVVTVVVLLILAGISINYLLGPNNIFDLARKTKEETENAINNEKQALSDIEKWMGGKIGNSNEDEIIYKDGIWRAKKNTEANSGTVKIYVYSEYYDTDLDSYKERYVVNAINDNISEELGHKVESVEELTDIFMRSDLNISTAEYMRFEQYLHGVKLESEKELLIYLFGGNHEDLESFEDFFLKELGFTEENITQIEKEYEEHIESIKEKLPEEIKSATYTITFPDGTSTTVTGSDLITFKKDYEVKENKDYMVEIDNSIKKEATLKIVVNNYRRTVTDEWYTYTYDSERGGYRAETTDKTLSSYGMIKTSIDGFDVKSLAFTFENCANLTEFSFKGINIPHVESLLSTFYGCDSLRDIDLSGLGTGEVENMWSTFAFCSSLTHLDVSNVDTSSVRNMNSLFYSCHNLTDLDLSGFNTRGVKDMSHMFANCDMLASIDVSGFDTTNVSDMFNMFYDCKSLTDLDVSSFDTSNVVDTSGMFGGCSSLSNLDLSNFNTSKVTNMERMFDNCTSLKEINLSSFNTENVTKMSDKIGAFTYGMFENCKSLTELDLSSFDTSKVTKMQYLFKNCTNLKIIYVGEKWITENADTTDMFSGCGTDKVTKKVI